MGIEVARRRALLGALLRAAMSILFLLVAYFLAPLDRPLNRGTGLMFGTAILLFGLLVVIEIRGILQSQRPKLRAIRALAVGVPLLIVIFAATYCTVATQEPDAFSEPLNRMDGLYFTVTVFATVGFGDIAPVTQLARVLVTIQMVVGLLTVGVIAKVVLGAVKVAETRQTKSTALAGVPKADDL